MYDLIKDIYPQDSDQKVRQLEQMEKDSARRLDLMTRREDIYREIQDILSKPDPDNAALAAIEQKLDALRRMVDITG